MLPHVMLSTITSDSLLWMSREELCTHFIKFLIADGAAIDMLFDYIQDDTEQWDNDSIRHELLLEINND